MSKGDWVQTKTVIPVTKSAIKLYFGYRGCPRELSQRLSTKEEETARSRGIVNSCATLVIVVIVRGWDEGMGVRTQGTHS